MFHGFISRYARHEYSKNRLPGQRDEYMRIRDYENLKNNEATRCPLLLPLLPLRGL